MRVGIVGGRDYPDLWQVQVFVQRLAKKHPDAVIVSGGARGVDTVAAVEARLCGLGVVEHIPDYDKYGRHLAPLERNTRIINDVDVLVAFWDGVSRGTKDSIDKAGDRGIKVKVISPPAAATAKEGPGGRHGSC